MSRYHASPRPFTFLSLICCSGLKCTSSNVRPFSSQLVPAAASEATRASVTSPAFAVVCAGALQPTPIPSAKHAPATPRTRNVFIQTTFHARRRSPMETFPIRETIAHQTLFAETLRRHVRGAAETKSNALPVVWRNAASTKQRVRKKNGGRKMVDVTGLEPATPCLQRRDR